MHYAHLPSAAQPRIPPSLSDLAQAPANSCNSAPSVSCPPVDRITRSHIHLHHPLPPVPPRDFTVRPWRPRGVVEPCVSGAASAVPENAEDLFHTQYTAARGIAVLQRAAAGITLAAGLDSDRRHTLLSGNGQPGEHKCPASCCCSPLPNPPAPLSTARAKVVA